MELAIHAWWEIGKSLLYPRHPQIGKSGELRRPPGTMPLQFPETTIYKSYEIPVHC